MKKIIFIITLLLITGGVSFAEDAIYLSVEDIKKPEVNEAIKIDIPALIEETEEDKTEEVEEIEAAEAVKEAQIEKTEPKKAELEYNVIYDNTPLLKKYTHMNFKEGPFEYLKPSFTYSGNMNMGPIGEEDYHTMYNNSLVDFQINGKFRNAPIEFVGQYNLLSKSKYNYMQTLLKDNFLRFNYIPHHSVTVGYFRLPTGIEGESGARTLPFINKSQMAKTFGNTRGLGFKIEGNYSLADYNIGVTSSDRMFQKFFPGAEFNSWFNLKPLGKTHGEYGELKIGGGLQAGRRDENYLVVSTGLSYKYKKMALFAEYGISDGSNGSTGFTKKRAQGVVITAAYNITKKLQFLIRYDMFQPDRTESTKTISEYSAGINYFIRGSALKLMLNYVYRHQPAKTDSHRIIFGTQIVL